jgi:hypothetical protein
MAGGYPSLGGAKRPAIPAALRRPDPAHRFFLRQPRGEGMADSGLFIGWGQVVRGRERKALDVFNESVSYWGGLQGDGRIESVEVVLLEPHGGDLAGFALLRGSAEQMGALRQDEEFQRQVARADLIIDRQGVVGAALGDGIAQQIGIYQESLSLVE